MVPLEFYNTGWAQKSRKSFMSLAVLIQYPCVTDGQTPTDSLYRAMPASRGKNPPAISGD